MTTPVVNQEPAVTCDAMWANLTRNRLVFALRGPFTIADQSLDEEQFRG